MSEIRKVVEIAEDLIDSNFDQNLELKDVWKIACLIRQNEILKQAFVVVDDHSVPSAPEKIAVELRAILNMLYNKNF